MNRMYLCLSALLLLSIVSVAQALTLTCTEEFSGMPTTVSVPGARNLDEAKQTIRNNPLYWNVRAESCRAGGRLEPMRPKEPDTNRAGLDYDNFDLDSPDPDICKDTCAGDPRCKAWTYVKPGYQGAKARCWLKEGRPATRRDNCCISGQKQ